ncbi:MAG: transposase [Epulopiscium sp. Nele67-Bin004]|nr:MAG: transposase [Epulopiscium sp. Nele67-Bin004]
MYKKAYKIEIIPTLEQKEKINKTIGVCRFIYNFYLSHNIETYEINKGFITGYDFSKWLNNEFLPNNKKYSWIKEVSSKAVKQAIMNGHKAFNKFFAKEADFPKFKKKNKSDVKAYFPKNNETDWAIERHKVKIPTLGWVRFKEYGYCPVNSIIKSGTVSKKADRYYVSILVEEPENKPSKSNSDGVGIDLGLKDFVICSNGDVYKNINKTTRIKKAEKRLKREQRKLSRKYDSLKKSNNKKGGATRQNIQKQVIKVQKAHQTLNNIRTDYINKVINKIVKTKPSYIALEDLNVKGMMKNKHLSKAVANQRFSEFRTKTENKCKRHNIELRIIDRWHPSSKLCSCCGNKKIDLKLSDRTYKCDNCNTILDRDLNASYNLKNAKKYKIA